MIYMVKLSPREINYSKQKKFLIQEMVFILLVTSGKNEKKIHKRIM